MTYQHSRWYRGFIGALALLGITLAAGCATAPPAFRAEVTTLADAPAAVPATPSFRFLEPDPQRAGSLEWRAERNAVRAGLERVGMRQVAAGMPPEMLVAFDYRVEPFDTYTEVAVPVTWGYSMLWGPINDGIWGGGIMSPPMYQYQAVPTQAWRHVLEISLRRANEPNVEVYFTRAVHESMSGDALAQLPLLVEAALANYPQGGNHTQVVSVPRPVR